MGAGGGLLREPLYAGEPVDNSSNIEVCASPTDYPQIEIDGYMGGSRQQFSHLAAHQNGEIQLDSTTRIMISVYTNYTNIRLSSSGAYIQRVVGIRAAD